MPGIPVVYCRSLPSGGETDSSGSVEFAIPAALRGQLIELANALQVPIQTVLLAGHMRVISMLSGRQDVVTGLVSHTRPHERDGEKVLGLFLTTMPFRIDLRPGSWKELYSTHIRLRVEGPSV